MLYKDFKGMKLSALGMGAMRLPVIDSDISKIDAEATDEMVAYAIEKGINYSDTAWGYHNGNSEIVIGECLKKYPRDSFYLAGQRAGIPAGILIDVYDLLAFEMDFERDVRAGQKFSVLYEENFSNGQKIDNGRVLAVEFEALRGNVQMYRFRKSDGTTGYYDAEGNGAIKSLKRTPINNAKVTSSFSRNRKHPVLGYTRAHKGVDFRASTGTPIPAAGAGRVIARSYNKGHGNFVKIRHNGSYETLYAHMSKFAKGVNVGTNVRQGQTIGYVGSTGYSTGPHLHYEIIKDGVHVNPMTVKLPAISNLDKSEKKKFVEYRKLLEQGIEKLEKNPALYIQL